MGAALMMPSVFGKELWSMIDEEVVENLVIGSGYGGAVAALRLTQAGKKVHMLEMGLDWEKDDGAYKPFSNLITPKNNSDRKSTRLNSSHVAISYAVFCLKKKKTRTEPATSEQ